MRQETGPTGNVLAARSFDPFGVPLEGDGGTPFGYAGEQYDASTGLLFLRARYYNPQVGRFLSRDPFPGLMTRPSTQHAYAYALNNPVRFTDPSGHCSRDDEACWAKLREIEKTYTNVHIQPSDLWSADELNWVLIALNETFKTFRHDADWFQRATGDVTYWRVPSLVGGGDAATLDLPLLPPQILLSNVAFSVDENFAVTSVMHETGHVIDNRAGGQGTSTLSFCTGSKYPMCVWKVCIGRFQPGGGTVSDYARMNPAEEFAETFAALVVAESGRETAMFNTTGDDQIFKMKVVESFLSRLDPDRRLEDFWFRHNR